MGHIGRFTAFQTYSGHCYLRLERSLVSCTVHAQSRSALLNTWPHQVSFPPSDSLDLLPCSQTGHQTAPYLCCFRTSCAVSPAKNIEKTGKRGFCPSDFHPRGFYYPRGIDHMEHWSQGHWSCGALILRGFHPMAIHPRMKLPEMNPPKMKHGINDPRDKYPWNQCPVGFMTLGWNPRIWKALE